MFYVIQNESLIEYGDNITYAWLYPNETKELEGVSTSEYEQDTTKYIIQDGELVPNPNWETEQLKKLEKEFDSQFFEIPNFGYFRRIPKGYNSAVESLNTVCSAVTFMKALPQGILTFYHKPDFTKPEQCTEEWIVNNSYKNKAMTLDEFAVFYTTFITAWNTQEHL